ncbi:MAG: GNAT family N-acetyltransferase [Flavobacteriaceae bacterium]
MSILDVETSPVLESERLRLRQVTLKDVNEVFFLRSDKTVGKYIMRPPEESIKTAEAFILARQKDVLEHKSSYWAITVKEDDTLVGSICLWNFSKDNTVAELGYDLHPDFQKQGIMTEAVRLVLRFGFQQLELCQIDAYTHKNNKSSIELLLKHQFTQHPTRKDDHVPDNIIFELPQSEYTKHQL